MSQRTRLSVYFYLSKHNDDGYNDQFTVEGLCQIIRPIWRACDTWEYGLKVEFPSIDILSTTCLHTKGHPVSDGLPHFSNRSRIALGRRQLSVTNST